MKKLLVLTLCFILCTSIFTGCGSDTAQNTDTAASATTAAANTSTGTSDAAAATASYNGSGPVTDQPVTLTFLANNSYYTDADLSQASIVKELVKRSGVTIEWQLLPPANYKDAVAPRLAAGNDLPDIVQLPDMDPTMKYINGGLFAPINDLYDKYGVNLKKVYSGEYAELKASLTTPDGKMYYVPQIGLGRNYQPCYMINMRWLDKLGLKEPATIDEFTEMLRAFKTKDLNGNGKEDEIPLSIEKAMIPQAFGPLFGINTSATDRFYADKDGKVHLSYLEPAYKEYVTYLHMLYKEKLLDQDFATTTRDQEISRFATDTTGVTFSYSWHMSQSFSNQFKDYDGKTPIVKGIVPFKGATGDQYYQGRNPGTGIFGISANSKNAEVAFKFLDFAISDEAQLLYNWGIEGDTYTVENGKTVYTENGKNNDYIQKAGIDPVNLPLIQSTAMAEGILPAWHVEVDNQITPYVRSPWPQIYSLAEEASIENQYLTDITTYCDEMELKFILGTESLDNFDKYQETLKGMHAEELIKIRQAQYDRFAASSK
jgi:putative aldouronate transport system substrate-binding protein